MQLPALTQTPIRLCRQVSLDHSPRQQWHLVSGVDVSEHPAGQMAVVRNSGGDICGRLRSRCAR